jgi:hypothetical protein
MKKRSQLTATKMTMGYVRTALWYGLGLSKIVQRTIQKQMYAASPVTRGEAAQEMKI